MITSNESAESGEDLQEAAVIADSFKIEYGIYDERASARVLGFPDGFAAARSRRHSGQPRDEAETVASSWAQDLNFQVAYDAGRAAIVLGFNQEDVIVDRIYQALAGQQLDPYPRLHPAPAGCSSGLPPRTCDPRGCARNERSAPAVARGADRLKLAGLGYEAP